MRWPAARGGLVAVSLAMLLGTGCAHRGSAASTLPPTSSASPVAATTARATITILVPRNVPHLRRPAYVSPATTAVSISVNNGTPVVVSLTPSSPNCTTDPQGVSCSVTIDAPVGTDSFAVSALDANNAVLSRATVPYTIVAGQANTVPLTLDGVVAKIVVALPDPPPPLGTPTSVPVLVTAKDADSNAIIGPGNFDNPMTLTDTDSQKATTLSTTTVSAPATTVTLAYNGAPMSTPATIGASATGVPAGSVTVALFTPAPAPSPTATPTSGYVDWNTFGFDLGRTGYNPNESVIGVGTVANLKLLWSKDLGSAIIAQPLVAPNVLINGVYQNVLYVGTQGISNSNPVAQFYAINADTGATIWKNSALGAAVYQCSSYPFGVAGTATFDRTANLVYAADGQDRIHAFNMATGAEAPGWPITLPNATPGNDFIYSGLTLNTQNHLLYVETSSTCDISPWYGRIVAVNVSGPLIAGTFYPTGSVTAGYSTPYLSGGGIWGYGGASIDTSGNVYVATGNSDTTGGAAQNLENAESVLQLGSTLALKAANKPGLPPASDIDFGATPMLFTAPGCPLEAIALNKSGDLVLYQALSIASGPLLQIQMAPATDAGNFIGSPAYDPITNLVYVSLPSTYGSYPPGMAALKPVANPSGAANCTLALQWTTAFGSDASTLPNDAPRSPPAVANGVVYQGGALGANFSGQPIVALNAQTGQILWNSSSALGITAGFFSQPVIDGGHLFVTSYGGVLYAFGL